MLLSACRPTSPNPPTAGITKAQSKTTQEVRLGRCYESSVAEAVQIFGEKPSTVYLRNDGQFEVHVQRGALNLDFHRAAFNGSCTNLSILTIIPHHYSSPISLGFPNFSHRHLLVVPSPVNRSARLIVFDSSGRSISKALYRTPAAFEVDYDNDDLIVVVPGPLGLKDDKAGSIDVNDRVFYPVKFTPKLVILGPTQNPTFS